MLRALRRSEGAPDRVQFDLCPVTVGPFWGTAWGHAVHYTQNLFEDVTYRISGNEGAGTAMGSDVVVTGAAGDERRFWRPDFLWGVIDQQELLPHGSDERLEADIRAKIQVLGKDRGYMIALADIVQRDVSPQRVEKFGSNYAGSTEDNPQRRWNSCPSNSCIFRDGSNYDRQSGIIAPRWQVTSIEPTEQFGTRFSAPSDVRHQLMAWCAGTGFVRTGHNLR